MLFFFGSTWVVASSIVYWLFMGEAMPPQPLIGLMIGTAAVIVGTLLEKARPAVALRRSAIIVGVTTILIALAHNVASHVLSQPADLIRSPQEETGPAAVATRFLVGISLAMFGLILCMLSGRLARRDGTAWTVSLAVAIYYLLIGSLAGLLLMPYRHTWGPIWLSFGLWLLAALLRARPDADDASRP